MSNHFNLFLIAFMCKYRPHPKIKQLDMLHAVDYANMGLDQMNRKLQESKKNDESFGHAMQ